MAKATSEKRPDSDTFALRGDERLGQSFIIPKGRTLRLDPCSHAAQEVWPIVKELPGDAQIVGYIIRMVE